MLGVRRVVPEVNYDSLTATSLDVICDSIHKHVSKTQAAKKTIALTLARFRIQLNAN